MPAGYEPNEHLGRDTQWHLGCAGLTLPLDLISYLPSGPASMKDLMVSFLPNEIFPLTLRMTLPKCFAVSGPLY